MLPRAVQPERYAHEPHLAMHSSSLGIATRDMRQCDASARGAKNWSVCRARCASCGCCWRRDLQRIRLHAASGAVMLQPVSKAIGLGGSVQVPAGARLVSATVDGDPGYCTTTLTYSDPIAGPYRPTCYLDGDGDSRLETLWVAPGPAGFTYDLEPPVQYRPGQITSDASGYKYELLYQGQWPNSVRQLALAGRQWIGVRFGIAGSRRPALGRRPRRGLARAR
jgi:hypothetical protein